ncbi:MAG: hypothetical protein KDA67_02525 [Rhodobacteraceae bacterium]|nr:hypothetical protein [Paracoccaceae bacterium]
MSNPETGSTCRTLSWLAGVLLGILAFLFAWKSFEWGMILALIFGLIVFFVAGWLLIRLFCVSGRVETAGNLARAESAASAAPVPKRQPTAADDRKAVPEPVKAAKPESKAAPEAKPAETKATAATDGSPPKLKAARDGKPDDLKRIKGIGPGLEKQLHGMGIFHFDQIAAWTSAEIAWVDDNLIRFKGRASRDDWSGQAKTLAEGGETEFSRKVDKGSVY